MKKINFSFVVLTYNSGKHIYECLDSIRKSLNNLEQNAEVFVVDNGSRDNTRSILNGFQFCENVKFRVTLFEENRGTTYSRNVGLRRVSGENIVVLDSDAYVNSDVLDNLQKYLRAHPDCGLIAPKLTYPDGRYQISVDQFPTLPHKIKRFFFLKKIEGKTGVTKAGNVDYAISAFWMFRREVIDMVGLLDEKIFYSPEDVDFCIRIWKAGYKIVYLPDYSAVHDAQEISRSKGFKLFNKFSLSHMKGLLYLYMKHRFLFSSAKFTQ